MRITAPLSRILLIALFSLLTSCSSKQPVSPVTDAQMIEEISTEPTNLSAQQHIELAQESTPDQAVIQLLTATKLFYQEQNYLRSLWLADKVIPMIDDTTPNYIQENMLLSLIKVSSLQQLGYFSQSYTELQQLSEYAIQHNIKLSATYYRLLHAAYQYKQQPIPALNANLHGFAVSNATLKASEHIASIWDEFSNLSQWQLSLVAKDNAPNSKGWIQLTEIANKFSANPEQLSYQINMWQKKYKKHPATVISNQIITQRLTPQQIDNIAIILPLSGKQQAAGLAIQQGILASFNNSKTKKLYFIDSDTVNWHGLTNEFNIQNIDYVIGPLLKSNVDKYIYHTSMATQSQNNDMLNTTSSMFEFNNTLNPTPAFDLNNQADMVSPMESEIPIHSYLNADTEDKTIATLLLNIPDKGTLSKQHTVLSMRPEDEAKQAAATLSRKDFKHPVVLSQQNALSKRIAQAFVAQWLRITGDSIDIVYYNSGAQMQANIKSGLGVDKSKARINSLKSRLNKSIKTQTRNRRDIDMIYLVGNPEQTRLVKPYIEVNISPFADIIPVFASSRSHSTASDYSSNSDLQGLSFTEIPWLLTAKQDTELATLSQSLWPKRSDGLSRLFAMGYDSYQLINKIPLMQQAPYLQHWGQTGVLKLDENNILTRSLFWGEYKRNKVVSVVME